MSARTLRQTFATPFVVTLAALPAACMVQSPPPRSEPSQMRPPPQQPAQPQVTNVSNPPRPEPDQPVPSGPRPPMVNPPPPGMIPQGDERHWTVMRQGDRCEAYVDTQCPPNATCNPPPPTKYACIPEVTQTRPMKVVRVAGSASCQIEYPPVTCPPNTMCNPPRPHAVTCPQ